MITLFGISAIGVCLVACLRVLPLDAGTRVFISIFSISTVYYGLLAPLFWMDYSGGFFLGRNWSNEVVESPWIFLGVYGIVFVLSTISMPTSRRRLDYGAEPAEKVLGKSTQFLLASYMALGIFASLYTYFVGNEAVAGAGLRSDPLLLIFYQCSDVPIAAFLWVIGARRFNLKWAVLIVLYLVFTVLVGLRYKILLLAAPLLIAFVLEYKGRARGIRVVAVAIAGAALLLLFSIMTMSRVKFTGIDLDVVQQLTSDELLLGLFAESNIIFGLASTLATFGDAAPYVGLQPLADTLLQFIPRFLYPEKNLYGHIQIMLGGLGNTAETFDSGTAAPFFAEYYAMAGWFGVGAGLIAYTFVVRRLLKLVARDADTWRQYLIGIGFIAVVFGYYYFSRGLLAQIFKSLVFTFLPYWWLMKSAKLRRARLATRYKVVP